MNALCRTLLAVVTLFAMNLSYSAEPIRLEHASELQQKVDDAVEKAFNHFRSENLKRDEVAVTTVDLTNPQQLRSASHRGDARTYPASVIKLFYLEAAHRWMEDGKIEDTPELRRAMRDMIVESYNEATHYVIDIVTGTTSGPELNGAQLADWENKRNAINRYFFQRGYTNINANQKPWCEGPYGRERIFVGEKLANRNSLTTDATARLLTEIVLGRAVTPARSLQMLELMQRDPFGKSTDPDDQAHGFTGPALPAGAKLWSKAGWTSETRHDAAYIELPNGRKLVLVIFTVNHANNRAIIPELAKIILSE